MGKESEKVLQFSIRSKSAMYVPFIRIKTIYYHFIMFVEETGMGQVKACAQTVNNGPGLRKRLVI